MVHDQKPEPTINCRKPRRGKGSSNHTGARQGHGIGCGNAWGELMTHDNTGCDASATPIGAAWMREQAADLMDMASKNCRDQFTYPAKTKEHRDYQTGAIVHANAARAIRAIPLPTDADLLAEAMKLPEVAALISALNDAVESLEWCARDGRMTKSQSMLVEKWAFENRTALAPFTTAKETKL